ncbi:hypothetical protein [Sphingobium indicum]|uniref:hypothetical protein n=1 Tax=Sphingobium indicum TaxID=332055 RepID=UPI0012DFC2CC|nr:hypothetical protein [Sphingobium indicum]
MIIFGIIAISVILMVVFIATTIAGGRWHDQQKEQRERAEQARTERLRKEALSDPKQDP